MTPEGPGWNWILVCLTLSHSRGRNSLNCSALEWSPRVYKGEPVPSIMLKETGAENRVKQGCALCAEIAQREGQRSPWSLQHNCCPACIIVSWSTLRFETKFQPLQRGNLKVWLYLHYILPLKTHLNKTKPKNFTIPLPPPKKPTIWWSGEYEWSQLAKRLP